MVGRSFQIKSILYSFNFGPLEFEHKNESTAACPFAINYRQQYITNHQHLNVTEPDHFMELKNRPFMILTH